MKRRLLGEALLLMVAVSWGVGFIAMRYALSWLPTLTLLAVRFLLSFVSLALVFPSRVFRAKRDTWWRGALIGLFLTLGFVPQTFAMLYTSINTVAFLTGMYVVLVPLFQALLLRKAPGTLSAVGAVLSVTGLGILCLQPGEGLGLGLGELLGFLCAVGYAMHIISVGRFAPEEDPVAITAAQLLAAFLYTGVLAVTLEPLPARMEVGPAITVIYLVLCNTLGAMLIQNWAQQVTEPTRAALLLATEPVFAALGSYFLLGEVIGLKGFIGDLLIFSGMVMSQVESFREPGRARPETVKEVCGGAR